MNVIKLYNYTGSRPLVWDNYISCLWIKDDIHTNLKTCKGKGIFHSLTTVYGMWCGNVDSAIDIDINVTNTMYKSVLF